MTQTTATTIANDHKHYSKAVCNQKQQQQQNQPLKQQDTTMTETQ